VYVVEVKMKPWVTGYFGYGDLNSAIMLRNFSCDAGLDCFYRELLFHFLVYTGTHSTNLYTIRLQDLRLMGRINKG